MPALAMVQVFNLCFLAGKTAQVGAFSLSGVLTFQILTATLPFAVVAAASLLVGMRFRGQVDGNTYRRWLQRVLWVMVVVLIGQFLAGLG